LQAGWRHDLGAFDDSHIVREVFTGDLVGARHSDTT
jgi:hypothetical protein